MTGRKLQVLTLLARGLTNQEIGSALGITEKTVKTHITELFTEHKVRNRVELALVHHGIPISYATVIDKTPEAA